MNVLQLISSEGYYGAESMLVHLSDSLRELGCKCIAGVFENAHRPNVAVAEEARKKLIPVEMIQCDGRLDWNAVRAIRSCLETHKIDVVHSHGYKSNFYGYMSAAGSSLPIGLVATCHLWTRQSASVRFYDFIDGFVIRRFDAVVGVSDPIVTILKGLRVKNNKISRISNGMDFSSLQNAEATFRQDVSYADVVVGTVCRLTEQKGIKYLLEAARMVLEAHPKVLFAIVGDGSDRCQLEEMSKRMGIADRVIFTGLRRDIANIYASLDIFVLPSIDEGMPMALLEALAAGKAAVATDVGDVAKLVRQGETGILVKPRDVKGLRDSIARLVEDCALRERLGEAGKLFVTENYSATSMARQYMDLYRNVAAKRLAA